LLLMLSSNSVFSLQMENQICNPISCNDGSPANIRKVENDNTFVYSFQLITSPDQSLLDSSLEKFRQVEGFISLSINAQNEVEIVTTKNIEEKNTSFLLLISARLYGYIGCQIIA
jgi:hypothetical protein